MAAILSRPQCVNALAYGDIIWWRHRALSTLLQVTACFLKANRPLFQCELFSIGPLGTDIKIQTFHFNKYLKIYWNVDHYTQPLCVKRNMWFTIVWGSGHYQRMSAKTNISNNVHGNLIWLEFAQFYMHILYKIGPWLACQTHCNISPQNTKWKNKVCDFYHYV